MKKSTKIIATVIAVTLVITAMLVAIYAATAGNANITANVSWTAQAGVNLEFWAKATGGDESKEIAKTTITPTTTNTDANIIGDLSCNFTDTTDDGVNNPNAIVFTYYVRNKSLTPLNIKVTKTPAEAEESGTGAENHKPKVTLHSDTEGNNTLTAVSSTSGYDLKAGDIFTYSVTLSLAKGGTGTINADFGLAPNFDAGVTFNFNVGGNSNGTIVTSVDGASPTTVSSSTLSGQTLGEYLATQQTAEYSTGWFFDEGLTKVVSDDYLEVSLGETSISSFYNKTASTTGLVFTLSDDGNSYLVEGESETSPSGEVVIPNMYNGKPVSGFKKGTYSSPVFKENTNITSVVLSNNISEIVDYTFYYSSNISGISKVTIPNSVTSIGNSAFSKCVGLINIIIPNSVSSIGEFTFSSCSRLTSIEILNGVTSIGYCAFSGCSGLSSIKVPNSVTSIRNSAFSNCSGLTSIIIENGNTIYDSRNNCNAIIETVSNKLIQGCENTIIPNSVTSIGDSAFSNCSGLTSITIPNSVTSIGEKAFYACIGLKIVVIGNGVTSIERQTFAECSSLTSVTIGNSVTSIGNSAFKNCSGLTSIEIPESVTDIGVSAFKNCSGLVTIKMPSRIMTIGNNAFDACEGLTKIFIPKSVETLYCSSEAYSPFHSCSSSLKIYCEASEQPSGWGYSWNNYKIGTTLKTFDVTWGVTRAQFDAL